MASSRLFVAVLLTVCISAVFAAPTLTNITSTLPIAGSAVNVVQLNGLNFDTIGTINNIYIGGKAVVSSSKVSDTVIEITGTPKGWGQDIEVKVVYNTTHEVKARIAKYTPVVASGLVAAFDGDSASKDIVRSFGDAPTVITITGANFGDADATFNGVFRVVAGDYDAVITLHENAKIYATFANGAGKNLPITVILGTQRAVVAGVTLTFPPPTVTSVVVDGAKRATYVAVIIYGTGFGLPGHASHITVSFGPFPCVAINHVSDTQIKCKVSGSGSNQPVVISINGQLNIGGSGVASFGSSSFRFDFPNPITVGLETCVPPAGAADSLTPEICNCWSGYAPLDTVANTDCLSRAVCPGRTISASVVAESAPSRPVTYFKDDKLWIKQTSPIVKNRRDTIIQFAAPNLAGVVAGTLGASTCNYPGNIWAKKVNSLDCLDEFYGVLPWSQHGLCGFVEDPASITNPTTRWIKSNLVTTYTETFKRADGSIHFRKISNSFLITVSFTKQITALTSTPVTVSVPDVGAVSLDISISGDALYDVATKNTIISFVTTTSWPYKIENDTLPADWRRALTGSTELNRPLANVTLAVPQPGDLVCNNVGGSDCEQAWVLVLNTQPTGNAADAVCNLAGKVEIFSDVLFCRDYQPNQACAGSPTTNFTIVIGKTDLCDNSDDEADASKGLTYSLETFFDAELTTPQNVFQTGDFVYAKVIVSDAQATIDTITFNFVTVKSADTSSSVHTDVYALAAHGSYAAIKAAGDATGFNVTQEYTTPYLVPGNAAELHFRFRLDRVALNVIQHLSSADPSDMTQQIIIEAILDINYHGNDKKRSISLTNSNTVPAVAHSMITFYDMEVVEELEGHNNDAVADEEEFSLFASSSSVVVASVAAVVVAAAALIA